MHATASNASKAHEHQENEWERFEFWINAILPFSHAVALYLSGRPDTANSLHRSAICLTFTRIIP
jgi:hypothetical protein